MCRTASLLCLAIVALVSGCSSETAQRTAYETLQNVREQECLKNPDSRSDCGKHDSYDDYQRQRKELEPSE
jgi:curli biogenesis system outer membrane secretion channel CsgG